ncbi:MAG: hypothetical protein ACFFD5_06360 [Candidatus Thorarchaeota archaeon]
MSKKSSPEEIYIDVLNERLAKDAAINLLISLIEASEAFNIRAKSIEVIRLLKIENSKVFLLLENCLVSDESALVRNASIITLVNNYYKKAMLPLKWAIEHDNSVILLKTIYDLIKEINDPNLRFLELKLIDRLNEIYNIRAEADLFLNLEVVYSEFIGNPNLLIKKSWYKVMKMINLYPDYIGLNSRLFYLIGGGTNLTPLSEDINNLDFFRSIFLKKSQDKKVLKFRKRVKLFQDI